MDNGEQSGGAGAVWRRFGVLMTVAVVAFGVLFRACQAFFWVALAVTAGGLSVGAWWADRALVRQAAVTARRWGVGWTVLVGVGSAAALYGVFFVGAWVAYRWLPFAPGGVSAVYDLRSGTPPLGIALLLTLFVGPCEEFFWRGYVQGTLQRRYGLVGALGAAAFYALVHVASGNIMLTAAAAVCGVFWVLLYRVFGSLWINMISHGVWTVAIFVLWPILPPG